MVLTTKEVIENKRGILFVSHDADDGMWQFHSGTDVDMEDAMLVALEEIIEVDPAITAVADLPLGWVAWRKIQLALGREKKRIEIANLDWLRAFQGFFFDNVNPSLPTACCSLSN